MAINSYHIAYLVIYIFATHTLYRLMRIFFGMRKYGFRVELLSYFGYYAVVSCVYLLINIPIITMITNLVMLFLLTLNYKSTIKKKIVSTFLMYVIMAAVEVIAIVITGYSNFNFYSANPLFESVPSLILVQVLLFITVLSVRNFRNAKNGITMPTSYWFIIFMVPLSSLFMMNLVLEHNDFSSLIIIICISLLLFINISTFYLYDKLNEMFQNRLEKTSLRQQNDYYIQHFNNLKTNIDSVNAIEHDLNKHFLTLKTLIEGNEDQRALQYISQYNAQSSVKTLVSNTGNLLIDSIVNYKLENIIEDEINVNIDLNIPPVLNVADYDLTIILGNLIDNAISAMKNIEGSNMELKINWEKGLFFIHMENTFDGVMDIKNKKIVTTKKDKDAHGYGLTNVSKAVEKYDGILNIQTKDNVFIVDVLMYTV